MPVRRTWHDESDRAFVEAKIEVADKVARKLVEWGIELNTQLDSAEGQWTPASKREHLQRLLSWKVEREGLNAVELAKAIYVVVAAVMKGGG